MVNEVNQNYITPNSKVEDREFSHDQALQITTQFIHSLKKTKNWMMFLSILGFIIGAILVVAVVIDLPNYLKKMDENSFYYHGVLMLSFVLLLFAGLGTLMTSFSLLKYSRSMKCFITSRTTENLAEMFASQAVFWKVTGLFFIVMIGLLLAILLTTVALSLGMFSR